MVRFCTCWLVCCSLLPFSTHAAETPISAEFFLQSIEPEPSATMLHDFLEIYGSNFADCKDTATYLRALTYLVANGDLATVRDRLKRLEMCANLSEPAHQRIAALREQTGTLRLPTTPAVPPVPAIPSVPVAPVVVPVAPILAESNPVEPTPAATSVRTTSVIPAAPGIMEASPSPPAPSATPAESSSASAASPEPDTTSPAIAELLPLPQQAFTQQAVSQPETISPPPSPLPTPTLPLRSKSIHKNALRRTTLSVTPTIPMSSRIVPSSIPGTTNQPPSAPTPPPDTPPAPVPATSQASAKAPAWRTEAASRIVYRTGDEGTSRLLRNENTVALGYDNWTVSATALYLNAGTAGNNVFAGSYFRGRPQRSLLTEQSAFIPQITYDAGAVDVTLGLSPLGGEVSPLPTFRVNYVGKQLKLTAFQESVIDSLLSYTGFRDPFTGKEMGRVLRTGAKLGWDSTLDEHWFYGGALTGALVYGKNVKDNTQVRGEIYIGRTFGSIAVGSYSAVDHYRTNLNNYTFGHGGYYSPYLAATSVLFASWEYAGSAGRLKADISSGFLYETTRDSKQYYGTSGPQAFYAGQTHRRLSMNAGLEGSVNLAENLSLDSSLRIINSGDFTEARGALYVRWTF